MAKKYNLKNLPPLDFDLWSKVAEQDPDTFESMRLAAIEEFIESAPAERRQRLRCLQWRIDQERRLSRSPMGACIRISRMMWENLLGEEGLVRHIRYLGEPSGNQNAISRPPPQARVIPFRPE
ncbi:MAG TPA: DUF3135 domain-containing protein [Sedimenticola sp.]|nr:DUF3135 domain-containing protein [Sedimenticola sp.]